MKQSASLGADGQKGAGYLRNSMIVLLVGAFIDLFPLTGLIVGLISLVALWLVFKGWNLILLGWRLKRKLKLKIDKYLDRKRKALRDSLRAFL